MAMEKFNETYAKCMSTITESRNVKDEEVKEINDFVEKFIDDQIGLDLAEGGATKHFNHIEAGGSLLKSHPWMESRKTASKESIAKMKLEMRDTAEALVDALNNLYQDDVWEIVSLSDAAFRLSDER